MKKEKQLQETMVDIARRARTAARELARLSSGEKNEALKLIASNLRARTEFIMECNTADLERAREAGLPPAMVDRLTLTEDRVETMAIGIDQIVSLPDPVGTVLGMWNRPNGLRIGKVRVPIGVIGFIYESRPNVTVDAAGLCLKSGNAIILRGGSEAIDSNAAIADVVADSLGKAGLPVDGVQLIKASRI